MDPRKGQGHIHAVVRVHLHCGLGRAQVVEHRFVPYRFQKLVGILGIERLAEFRSPHLLHRGLPLQVESHDGQLPHGELRTGVHGHRHVHGLFAVVDGVLARDLGIHIAGALDRFADPLQPLVDALHVGHIAGLEIAGLQQAFGRKRRLPVDRNFAELVALAFVHRDEHMHSLDVLHRLGPDRRECDAHPAANLIERPDGQPQHQAEIVLGVGGTDGRRGHRLAERFLVNHTVAFEGHLRHRGQYFLGLEHDGKVARVGRFHRAHNRLLDPVGRQVLLDPPGISLDHRLGGRQPLPREHRVPRGQCGGQVFGRNAQPLELYGIDLLDLGDLENAGKSVAVGVGGEPVLHVFEGARRHQAVARRVEIRLAGHLSCFQSGNGHNLLARVAQIAFHPEALDGPLGRLWRGAGPDAGLPESSSGSQHQN